MSIRRLFNRETVIESMVIVFSFTIIQRIIQVARGIVFARWLGPAEYGVYTLAFFFIPLVVTLAKLGITSCYERYVPQYEQKGMAADFFKKNYAITIVSSLFFAAICVFFSKEISALLYASAEYKNIIIICGLTVVFHMLYQNFLSSFNSLRIFKMGIFLQFSQFFIFTIGGIALIIFYPRAEGLVAVNLISFIVVALIFGSIVQRYIFKGNSQNSRIEEKDFYAKIFKYSVWFVITPILFSAFHYTDRWMLNRFFSMEEVGIYSVTVNITGVIFMFGMVTGRVLMPNLSSIWEQGRKDRVVSILNFTFKINTLILLGCAVLLSLFKKTIISVCYGREYITGVSAIELLLVSCLFMSVFEITRRYGELLEKPYFTFMCGAVGLLINVFLNYILIPRYHIVGAAAAAAVSHVVILSLLFLLTYKEGMRFQVRTIFVCLCPLILFLNPAAMIVSFFILAALVLFTDTIILRHEKELLYRQIEKTIQRVKKRGLVHEKS